MNELGLSQHCNEFTRPTPGDNFFIAHLNSITVRKHNHREVSSNYITLTVRSCCNHFVIITITQSKLYLGTRQWDIHKQMSYWDLGVGLHPDKII